jgi:hypothetical protein
MYIMYNQDGVFTHADIEMIFHTIFYSGLFIISYTMITHRESYVFDTECKFCAHDTEKLVSQVNTKICPDCFTWIADSVGLMTLGIHLLD